MTDLSQSIRDEFANLRKSDISFAKHEETGQVFAIVNAAATEWETNGTFVVKTDGIAIKEPTNDPNANGGVAAMVQEANAKPDFLEDIVKQEKVWVVFTSNPLSRNPDVSFNLCDVVDMR